MAKRRRRGKKNLPQPVKESAKSRGADDFTAENEGEYDAQYDEWLAGGGVSGEGTRYELREGRPAAAGEREEGKAASRTLGAFEAHQKSMMSGTHQRKDSEYTNRWNDYLQTDKLQAMLAGDIPMDSKFLDGAAARYIVASEGHEGGEARDFIKMAKWLRYQKEQIPGPDPAVEHVEAAREARPGNIPLAATTAAADVLTGGHGDEATQFAALLPGDMQEESRRIKEDYGEHGDLRWEHPGRGKKPETWAEYAQAVVKAPAQDIGDAMIDVKNKTTDWYGDVVGGMGYLGDKAIDVGDFVQRKVYDPLTGYGKSDNVKERREEIARKAAEERAEELRKAKAWSIKQKDGDRYFEPHKESGGGGGGGGGGGW